MADAITTNILGASNSPSSTQPTPTTIVPATTVNTAPLTPGTVSTQAGALPGTTLNPQQMSAITNTNIQNAANPALSTAQTSTPVNQQVQSGENITQPTLDTTSDQVNSSVGQITPSTVGTTAQASQQAPIQAATYQATTVDPATLENTTQAITAALPADALVSNQLKELLTPDANGNLPSWVSPAVTAANQFLAGRGISNSTMAGQAITSAILTAAIPIATANANAVQSAWSQNLSNEQAASMQNGQAMVQAVLSNQGAENAASNFNATSTNQTNQFMAGLATQINQFNATQTNAISQFNSSQTQTAGIASAQLTSQIDQFNSNMANQREQFNAQNSLIVQQSNAEYLRQVNTANTAVANQDNQLNAQNAMNLSTQAMANLQTQFNDTATMLYNSNMTAEQQNYAMTYLSQQFGLQDTLNRNIISEENGQQVSQALGTLASNLFAPVIGAAGSAISNLFGSSTNVSGNGSSTNISGSSGGLLSSIGGGLSSAASSIGDAASSVFDSITSLFD